MVDGPRVCGSSWVARRRWPVRSGGGRWPWAGVRGRVVRGRVVPSAVARAERWFRAIDDREPGRRVPSPTRGGSVGVSAARVTARVASRVSVRFDSRVQVPWHVGLEIVVSSAERPEIGRGRGTVGPRHRVVEVATGGRLSTAREPAVRLAGAHQACQGGAGHIGLSPGGRHHSSGIGDPRTPASVSGKLAGDLGRDGSNAGNLGGVLGQPEQGVQGDDDLDLGVGDAG